MTNKNKNLAASDSKKSVMVKPKKSARVRNVLATQSAAIQKKASRITKDGWDWIVQATDPFHDSRHEIAGYPDIENANSVVRTYQATYDVVAPGGATWDCHIFSLPITVGHELSPATALPTVVTPAGAHTDLAVGMFSCYTANAAGVSWSNSMTPDHTFSLPANEANYRVIAAGFEVTDTSAEINKQGSVTVYRLPNRAVVGNTILDDEKKMDGVNLHIENMVSTTVNPPPATHNAMTLIPGAKIWEARKGCYVPLALHDEEMPVQRTTGGLLVMRAKDTGDATADACSALATIGSVPKAFAPSMGHNNFQTSGAFFAGLNAAGTLRVTYKVYVEIFPNSYDNLISLATPSAMYDPHALEVYSAVMALMPFGTPVGNNANGDWFKQVLKTVRKVLDPIIGVVGKFLPVQRPYDEGSKFIENFVDQAGRLLPFLP